MDPEYGAVEHREQFTVCAVHAQRRVRVESSPAVQEPNLSPVSVSLLDFPLSVSCSEMVKEPRADLSLIKLFELVRPVGELKGAGQGYFLHDELLVRKCERCGESFVGDSIVQVVVPIKLCNVVFKVSHDQVGHLRLRKMFDFISHYCFGSRMKRDVDAYIRHQFHISQLTGTQYFSSAVPEACSFGWDQVGCLCAPRSRHFVPWSGG